MSSIFPIKKIISAVYNYFRYYTHLSFIRILRKFYKPKRQIPYLVGPNSGFLPFTEHCAALGFALELRGYTPHFILCDASCQGACILPSENLDSSLLPDTWVRRCVDCEKNQLRIIKKYGFSFSFLSEYLTDECWKEIHTIEDISQKLAKEKNLKGISAIRYCNIAIGQDIFDTLVRHYRDASCHDLNSNIVRLYTRMAAITTKSFMKIIKNFDTEYFFIPHPQYSPSGPIGKIICLFQKTFFHYSTHHKGNYCYKTIFPNENNISSFALSKAAWKKIQSHPLTQAQERQIINFFQERYVQKKHEIVREIREEISNVAVENFIKKYTIDINKPVFAVYSHLTWDNAFGFGNVPFESFDQWIDYTIHILCNCIDTQWLIKIHPAEMFYEKTPQRYGVATYIREHFPNLPKHIKIIPPNEKINQYDFLHMIDGMVSCCGTSGLEAAIFGKTVINACMGYYADLGFTHDATSKEHYKELLVNISNIKPMTEEEITKAKKFFYTYFFKRNIICTDIYDENFAPKSLYALWKHLPHKHQNLDLICTGFINKTDILLP